MVISDKILPIRFYSDLYDQNRFSKNCHDSCQLDLVYPASGLPHFQIKRDSIFAGPSKMFLRNVCNDIDNNYYKEIPEGADSFCSEVLSESFYSQLFPMEVALETTIPAANYLVDLFTIDCCKLKMISANIPNNATVSYITLSLPSIVIPIASSSDNYKFKIIIDKLVGTSTIKVYNGANPIDIITSAGAYEYEFTSAATNITIYFDTISYGDYLEISYMQATRMMFDSLLTNDVNLNPSDISVVNLTNGTDILSYCTSRPYTNNINSGYYYYVVKSANSFYFSEVFKIVSLREIQNYFKITWYDDCDFNSSVLYSTDSIPCNFRNILYLDAGLFKPEYDTSTESEVNGQGDLVTRFKKWQKNISLEIGKSPEFLTDALSAIFLHDNVSVLQPVNWKQDVQSNEFEVLKVTNDIGDVVDSCYQKVVLKLLLDDIITDTACCNQAEIISCDPCTISCALDAEGCTSYYATVVDGNLNWWATGASGVPRYSFTIRDCQGNVVNPRPEDIVCYDGNYYKVEWFSGLDDYGNTGQFWYASQTYITMATAAFAFVGYYITGYLLPNTWGQAYFQINGVGPWILADTFSVGSTGAYTYLYTAALLMPYLPYDKVVFKVINVTPNCEFGETNTRCVGSGC